MPLPMPTQISETDHDRFWTAVTERDASMVGEFVFAVKTTGVFCRPGCPARTPNRENVIFFADCSRAKRAGYRACMRCKPEQAGESEGDSAMIAKAVEAIRAAVERGEGLPTVSEIARQVGLGERALREAFKVAVGVTPSAYVSELRAQVVRDRLMGKEAVISEVVYEAGFGSSGRFYEAADGMLGMSPGAYRAGGAGETIRYAVAACALGKVLVAQSSRGICAILLGDLQEALRTELEGIFCKAELAPADGDFSDVVQAVAGMIDEPRDGIDLPLDIRGTAFQRRVWDALRGLRPGERISYSELAERIGSPGSVRAVAGACAANKIAVAIPCHRVVKSDGSISGYRWGVDRKRELLDREES